MAVEAGFTPPEPAVCDRMAGDVGYDDVRELLPAGRSWFELRTARWSDERAGLTETGSDVDAWVADACPLRPGRHYAAYFFELDAWSEYWDLYHPETCGLYHFGDGELDGYLSALLPGPGRPRSPVFDAWKAYALASRDQSSVPEARRQFEEEAARPEVAEAALAVDELVRGIFDAHFDAATEADAYFDALERFAFDSLPPCPQRYALIADDDPRKLSSPTHRLAGDVMWFAWAVHLECARVAAGPDDTDNGQRALLMAGVALGCSLDYAFTGRCRTRREYRTRDVEAWARAWKRGRALAGDFDVAAAEVRELFFIRTYDD